jgi:ABC-type methionine transport system permease subunit
MLDMSVQISIMKVSRNVLLDNVVTGLFFGVMVIMAGRGGIEPPTLVPYIIGKTLNYVRPLPVALENVNLTVPRTLFPPLGTSKG